MYSQNDEERFVTEFFAGKTGTLLDVGAFNGINMSNSRKLLEQGWSGVLVEPMWSNFEMLCANSAVFGDRVMLVCAALAPERSLKRFWTNPDPDRLWNTTVNPEFQRTYVTEANPQKTWVAAITMDDLWQFGPFDFITLDTEGEDFAILKSQLPERWVGAQLICVETGERQAMRDWFREIGFEQVHETPENLIVKRK